MFGILIFVWLFGFVGAFITYIIYGHTDNPVLKKAATIMLVAGIIGCLGSCTMAVTEPSDYSDYFGGGSSVWNPGVK